MLPSLFRLWPRRTSTVNAALVLGMHRSGTRSLAGSLQERGLRLGKVFTSNPYNRKGNREHATAVGTFRHPHAVDRIANGLGLRAAAVGGSFFESSLRHEDGGSTGPQAISRSQMRAA